MSNSKSLLIVAGLTFLMTVGCVGKKRIEGTEIPTQPDTNEVVVSAPVAPPPVMSEAPPVPEPTPEPQAAAPPPPEPTPEPKEEAPPPPEANPCNKYIVVKGDTLWDISGTNSGYHDNFQWPLIFKANRDQITDPDLIYPKQEFCIRQDFDDQEIKKARKDAINTPTYVPHTKPREVLPLNYF